MSHSGIDKRSLSRVDPRTQRGSAPRAPSPLLPSSRAELEPGCRDLLDRLLDLRLLSLSSASHFLEEHRGVARLSTPFDLGQALVAADLLTEHQLQRVLSGRTHGLVVGHYRILEKLGEGGMGTVYLAEHVLMKRRVAVKVLPVDADCPHSVRERFYSELRVLAGLHHPNIVWAFDAGEVAAVGPHVPPLIYLVMEVVSGGDLEDHVQEHGPQPLAQACDWIRQAACGLQEAHDHHLIHRDVKPSNLLLDRRGVVKLVDFGLVRQFASILTDPRALLGSVEFMAPEQSFDATAVSAAADIYGLGATLFWLLTGEPPYPLTRQLSVAVRSLQHEPPRRLRSLRPDAPAELDDIVAWMLHRDPKQRPSSPLSVMNALLPFTLGGSGGGPGDAADHSARLAQQVLQANRQLEQSLAARAVDVRQAQDALLFAMAKMAESRDQETPGHLKRLQLYACRLAETVATAPPWLGLVDAHFLEQLERCVPLHDIGKIGLPDDVLLKPGPLDPLERALVETHPLIGDRILESLAREHGQSLVFLGTARAIVRHHHERFDGRGYPDRLAGDAIPAVARLVAVADVYDALRRERLYKPALPHTEAVRVILERSPGQFDPLLLQAFAACHRDFERIYVTITE
jgi:serine/threonine protein kinase